ncbi:MAG TPA: Dabb family protein [bacterium]|nr:Dabb family protein [bacterium]HOL34436.1 Dabb family protein [bacterium]HPP08086.1 Dabb family protein [bacterium]
MHQHYVMFKIKKEHKKDLPEIAKKLKSLQDSIRLIRMSEVFVNQIQGPHSFDIMFHAEFDDTESFKSYMDHPAHKPVQQFIEARVEPDGIADIDFVV